MKKSTLSHFIGKSQHYLTSLEKVSIISKSRLFVDIFAISSITPHYYQQIFGLISFSLYNSGHQKRPIREGFKNK